MDFYRNIQNRLRQLEQQQIIDIKSLQIWCLMLIVTFCSVSWLWERFITQQDPLSHFPPSLLPIELRKKLPAHGFTNEEDARRFAIREIEAAVIACQRDSDTADESAADAVYMMKSAALLTKSIIHFHIYTEDKLYPKFMQELDKWPSHVRHRVSFKFSHVTYPESVLGWKNLHRPCSSFKLFLPHVLKDIDFAMYIDNDSIFLNSLDSLWSSLIQYNDTNSIALAATELDNSTLFRKYGIQSLDTRVLIFDIFRLRHTVFSVPVSINQVGGAFEFGLQNMTWHPNMLHAVYRLFSEDISVPDQDILSILYHFNPEKFLLLPCEWTFRYDYCTQYLSWVTARFLNATLKYWPLPNCIICPHSFLLHKQKSYLSHEEGRKEFSDLQSFWMSASYETPKASILKSFDEIFRSKSFPSTCYKLNMKYFRDSCNVSTP